MTALASLLRLTRRELRVAAAGREATTVVVPFVVAAVVLAGLGFGPRPDVLSAVAPGLSWLVVLFAAVPLTRGVAAVERDEGCWDLLRALVPATVLWGGKLTAMWLWLAATWTVATLLVAVLFAGPLPAVSPLAGGLGTLGLAAVTVTFGTVLAEAPSRSGLLAVLLLPAGLPALLAGTQAMTPGVGPQPWLALLAAYDAVALAVAWAVFPLLLEE